MSIIKKFLNQYVYQDWNIAIADISEDLSPINIKWLKHNYRDRWFADPFIIEETEDSFVILVEECLHKTMRGRLAKLTASKADFRLLENETILDLPTHLSFPNPINIDGHTFIYPENAAAGNTKIYKYDLPLKCEGTLSELPLADPTIVRIGDNYYLLATLGEGCNGNILNVYKSSNPTIGYSELQKIAFDENIARRSGNAFEWHGKLISPAQICNHDYGEGVSLQEITQKEETLEFHEIKRMFPLTKEYPEGFHTYNVFGNKVVIDGYRYGSKFLHNLYFKLRSII